MCNCAETIPKWCPWNILSSSNLQSTKIQHLSKMRPLKIQCDKKSWTSTRNPMSIQFQKLNIDKLLSTGNPPNQKSKSSRNIWKPRNTQILNVFEQYISIIKIFGRLGLSSWDALASRLGQFCLGLSARDCRGRHGARCRPATLPFSNGNRPTPWRDKTKRRKPTKPNSPQAQRHK